MKNLKIFEDFSEINEEENSRWEVLSARRADGKIFSIGDKYQDANRKVYTIDKLEFFKKNLVAHAKEGGKIDLFNVKKV